LNQDPGNGEALNLLGVVAMQTGRPAEAAGLVGRAVQTDSRRPDFHYNLGMAHWKSVLDLPMLEVRY